MANTKSAAVRQLLFDLGLAIGTFLLDVMVGFGKAAGRLFRAAFVLGVVMFVIFLIYDNWDDLTTPVVELYTEATINCGKLQDELRADIRCISEASCTMSRDEMVESEERQEKYQKFCFK